MGRTVLKIKGYTPEKIRSLFNERKDLKTGMRLYAVYQVALGKPSRQLEDFYNVSFKQILNWAHRFEEEGLSGLSDKPGRGRKPFLSEEQKKELADVLLEKQPEEFGYNSATWTGPLLIVWIKDHFGVEYKKVQIYNIIKSLGFTFQKGKGVFPEADSKKQEEFKEALKKTP